MSTTNGVRAALNQRSRTLVHGADRAGARAMLKAVGSMTMPSPTADRRRQYLDRDRTLQLPPAQAGG